MTSTVVNSVRDINVLSPVILLVAASMVFICWQFLLTRTLDPREPPEVKPAIPVLGHFLGMIWHRADYVTILR
jgi:hypothetical protein